RSGYGSFLIVTSHSTAASDHGARTRSLPRSPAFGTADQSNPVVRSSATAVSPSRTTARGRTGTFSPFHAASSAGTNSAESNARPRSFEEMGFGPGANFADPRPARSPRFDTSIPPRGASKPGYGPTVTRVRSSRRVAPRSGLALSAATSTSTSQSPSRPGVAG